MKREQRSIRTSELRTIASAEGRTLTGIIPYNSRSEDLGGFVEVIAPGAFASALDPGADVLMFRDHKSELLMGRTKSGTLTLEDSTKGLKFTCQLPNTTQAADLAASIDRGDLDSNSFGFTVDEDVWSSDSEGNVLRTLLSVTLFEVSAVSMPAYSQSSVSLRTCPAELRSRLTVETRDDDPEEASTADKCACDCAECEAGDCADCTNPDCDDAFCNCDDDEFDSVRCLMEMQLELRRRAR